ncbi:MAG: tRNA (adenosine(37)-N6)-threonylcarbamoyltransferase complex ATPase subunit type 1 TsaE [Alphaproteobacteria bacterium]|nr:MAG: tRNA (adenosine(37)-N6)-threonylcarbamoyltransferase complex ATPase subunit type 1 TsaE [Alphaproteobacteria bacterium]
MSIKNGLVYTDLSREALGKIAAKLADFVRMGDVVLLEGNLGAGKTEFTRIFLRHLTGKNDLSVPSPTFTLVQQYDTPKGEVWHFDLYRLEDPLEIEEIGWTEALTHGISLIEWPDRLGPYLPEDYLRLKLDFSEKGEDLRNISITPHGTYQTRAATDWKI